LRPFSVGLLFPVIQTKDLHRKLLQPQFTIVLLSLFSRTPTC
jgi:hypothetical protein